MAYFDDTVAISTLDFEWQLDGDELDSIGPANSDGGTDPSFVTGIIPGATGQQCGDYNGTTMETLIPNQSVLNSGTTTNRQCVLWTIIDTIDTSGNGRVLWGEGGGTNGLSLYVVDDGGQDTLYFDIYVGSTHDTLTWTGVQTGTLYMIGFGFDCTAGTMTLWVNGSVVASKSGGLNIGSTFASHSGGMAFGGVDSTLDDAAGAALTGFFDGRLQGISIWAEQAEFSDSQLDGLYASGLGGPAITDVDGDDQVDVGQLNVVMTGTSFGASQTGPADVEFGSAATYGASTLVSQSIDSWADTSIQFDVVQGGLTAPGTVWVYVTDSAGSISSGYPIQLGPFPPTITDMEDEQLDTSETDNNLVGTDFLASQGTGVLEISDNAVYATGTKVTQTINSWADALINFDFVQGALGNGTGWIWVTTDDGQRNAVGYPVNMGPVPQDTYQEVIEALTPLPQHLWPMQNNYTDVIDGGPSATPLNSNTGGTPSFSTTTPLLCRGDTHALLLDAANEFVSPNTAEDAPRSGDFNDLWESHWKTMWVRLDRYHQAPSIVWEEGASANDMCLVVGFGNNLLCNCLDSDGPDVQVFSDKPLKPNRTYFLAMKLEGTALDNEVAMYIDGVRQARDSGNPFGLLDMNAHNGDMCLGWNQTTGTFGTLIVGGTVISFGTAIGTRYSHMLSRHDGEYTDAQIADLFELGVGPDNLIASATPAVMQTAIEAFDDTDHPDASLTYYIDAPSGASNLTLDLTNQTFHPDTTLHLQWRGGGILTLVNSGTSDIDLAKCSNPWGGSIVVQNPATFTIEGLINGCELRIYDDNGASGSFGTELDGIESNTGTTFQYSHSGITNDILVQFMADGYVEITVPFTLGSSDQTLTLFPQLDTNQ